MGAKNPKRRNLRLEVSRIVKGCANAQGEYNYDEVRPVLLAFILKNPDYLEAERVVNDLLTEHRDTYKFKGSPNGQQELPFDLEDGIYVLGNSEAVYQRDAKPAHIRQAMRVHKKQFDDQASAYARFVDISLNVLDLYHSESETLADVVERNPDFHG